MNNATNIVGVVVFGAAVFSKIVCTGFLRISPRSLHCFCIFHAERCARDLLQLPHQNRF
jgi:hypothetical protein